MVQRVPTHGRRSDPSGFIQYLRSRRRASNEHCGLCGVCGAV
jgi:hypothetical protein